MTPLPPRSSSPDPRVSRPRRSGTPHARCQEVEPESGEPCEGMLAHDGPHSCRATVIWEVVPAIPATTDKQS